MHLFRSWPTIFCCLLEVAPSPILLTALQYIDKLSTCVTERRKSERKEREVATMAGLVGDGANYDDSKKVWSLVYNTCKRFKMVIV
jgi:hypothetical protein